MKRAFWLLLSVGCVGPDHFLIQQVSFQEKCPPEKVRLVEWGPQRLTADVNACGKPRTYRNDPVMYENSGAENWTPIVR